jgi:hypothetical protein
VDLNSRVLDSWLLQQFLRLPVIFQINIEKKVLDRFSEYPVIGDTFVELKI